jgi:hypothetical protein
MIPWPPLLFFVFFFEDLIVSHRLSLRVTSQPGGLILEGFTRVHNKIFGFWSHLKIFLVTQF